MHCLERASECERLAEQAFDPDAKTMFYRIAAHWRSLAINRDYIERFEHLLRARRQPLTPSVP
jgi:hypothetical protein